MVAICNSMKLVVLLSAGVAAAFHQAPSRRAVHHARRGVRRGAASDDFEAQAAEAAEAWDETATSFLTAEVAADLVERLGKRADIGLVVAGGYPGAERARMIFTNPELVEATDASQYAALVRVSADNLRDVAFYNVLADIGVDMSQTGDVLLDVDVVYVTVDPAALKTLERLLPKSLDGVCTVEQLPPGSAPEGALVPPELVRLDTRDKGKRR